MGGGAKYFVFFFFAFSLSPQSAKGKHTACPEGFDEPTSFKKRGIYYKILGNNVGISWSDALAQCEADGMGLAEMGALRNFELAQEAFEDLRDDPTADAFWVDLQNTDAAVCSGVADCADKFYDSDGKIVDLSYLSPSEHGVSSSAGGGGVDDCLLYLIDQPGVLLLGTSCASTHRALCSCKSENGSEFKAENILVDLATRNTFASAASTSSRPLPPSGDAALCAAMCRASTGCNAFMVEDNGVAKMCRPGTLGDQTMADATEIAGGDVSFYIVQ